MSMLNMDSSRLEEKKAAGEEVRGTMKRALPLLPVPACLQAPNPILTRALPLFSDLHIELPPMIRMVATWTALNNNCENES
jgi:hypothetical protein